MLLAPTEDRSLNGQLPDYFGLLLGLVGHSGVSVVPGHVGLSSTSDGAAGAIHLGTGLATASYVRRRLNNNLVGAFQAREAALEGGGSCGMFVGTTEKVVVVLGSK